MPAAPTRSSSRGRWKASQASPSSMPGSPGADAMSAAWLAALPEHRRLGEVRGLTSVCSAHPWVIEAALSAPGEAKVLIEATCNQVNQEGGYTGMTPADFRGFVEANRPAAGLPASRLILGGDHLGPNPWKHLPAEEAMQRAEAMVAAYVEAGFAKIHLDASMGCARRACRARRRGHRRRARHASPRSPSGGRAERQRRRRSTSSAPRCRRRAARPMRSTRSR